MISSQPSLSRSAIATNDGDCKGGNFTSSVEFLKTPSLVPLYNIKPL